MRGVGHHEGEAMRKSLWFLVSVLMLSGLSACTYNIQPAVPALTPIAGSGSRLNCKAVLLMPEEFANREYISSFEGREIRLMVGPPAAKAVEALIRSRYEQVDKSSASGDGTLDLVRLTSNQNTNAPIVVRPRFPRLESSVRPFRYSIEFGLTLDIAGLSAPVAPSGVGIGAAGLYVQSEIQKAADDALAQAISSLTSALPTMCQ